MVRVPVDVDRLLDALETCDVAGLDPFHDEEEHEGTDRIILGRCSADGFHMLYDPEREHPPAWRPWNVGEGIPCPGDPRTYFGADGQEHRVGNCRLSTFEAWRPGRRS